VRPAEAADQPTPKGTLSHVSSEDSQHRF
jgi:hypothetical protein